MKGRSLLSIAMFFFIVSCSDSQLFKGEEGADIGDEDTEETEMDRALEPENIAGNYLTCGFIEEGADDDLYGCVIKTRTGEKYTGEIKKWLISVLDISEEKTTKISKMDESAVDSEWHVQFRVSKDISSSAFRIMAKVSLEGNIIGRNSAFPLKPGECPAGYVKVPGNKEIYDTDDFCVMKYEAKMSKIGIVKSYYEGQPMSFLSQEMALGFCYFILEQARPDLTPDEQVKNVFFGLYHLISDREWMTIGLNLALQKENWSTKEIGKDQINRGFSEYDLGEKIVSRALPASSNDNEACYGFPEEILHGDCSGDMWNIQKRTHVLSNGEIIWDFAGNVQEWIEGEYFDYPNQIKIKELKEEESAILKCWSKDGASVDDDFVTSKIQKIDYFTGLSAAECKSSKAPFSDVFGKCFDENYVGFLSRVHLVPFSKLPNVNWDDNWSKAEKGIGRYRAGFEYPKDDESFICTNNGMPSRYSGTLARGGSYAMGDSTGIFEADLMFGPQMSIVDVGFRCAYHLR